MSLRTAALFCAIALAPYTHSRVDAAAADASDATRGVDQQPQAQLTEQPGAGELNELNLIGAADGVPLPTEADMLAHVAEWERRVVAADPAVWEAQIRQHRAGHAAGKRHRRLQEEQEEEAARNWDLETLGDLDVDTWRSVLDQPAAVRIGEAGLVDQRSATIRWRATRAPVSHAPTSATISRTTISPVRPRRPRASSTTWPPASGRRMVS